MVVEEEEDEEEEEEDELREGVAGERDEGVDAGKEAGGKVERYSESGKEGEEGIEKVPWIRILPMCS